MTDRERFIGWLANGSADRSPYWLQWGPWFTTWQRWTKEGMPKEFKDFNDVRRHFGSDCLPEVVPVNYGPCPKIEEQVLEENDEFKIWTDGWGIKRRNPKEHESMSEFMEFPVKSRDDWEKFKAKWLDPQHPQRLSGDWHVQCMEWMDKGYPIQLGSYPDVGLFGCLRWLLGDEECLVAFCSSPDLVHDIMNHLTDVYLAVFEKVVAEGVRVDVIHIWEDLCGRHGPLISPRHWEEFMGPGYRRIKEFADSHDIPLISVDTDGNPDLIMSAMLSGGVNFLSPMEVAAGCDVNEFQEKYPGMAMMGGIDKRALAKGPEAIDRELERVSPALSTGRYIPELDHMVPNDVSWQNYVYYAEQLKRLVRKG